MSEQSADRSRTRRIEPGLARRLSLGMGTFTLAGAAFFGIAAPDTPADVDTPTSSFTVASEV